MATPVDNRQLTGFDEFFVHQGSGPFSQIPSTDYAWDDGVFLAAYDVAKDVHVYAGLRVNPNSGMLGGYAGIVRDGRQVTVRFKRPWGPHFAEPDLALAVGPFRYTVVEPLQEINLSLGPNEAGLEFDLTWRALSPPVLEPHRLFRTRGRATTDQTRYLQAGTAQGHVTLDGAGVDLAYGEAFAVRDHSWGIYYERPPLAPRRKWVRPTEAAPQAFRLWVAFGSETATTSFQIHESQQGEATAVKDVLSVPFTGHVWLAADGAEHHLESGTHELSFEPGTRIMSGGVVNLRDREGRDWSMTFDRGMEPFLAHPAGYALGSWKDGGNIASYPGTDDPVVEFDEYDLRTQPCPQHIYGQDRTVDGIGTEYAFACVLTAPDGSVHRGQAYVELMTNGRFDRYGFTDDAPPSWLNMYHLMD